MSHASLIVVPTKEQISKHGIEEALALEMLPFDENGRCFRDGSRWDWYRIGGRFTGGLTGYDPYEDAANQEMCSICNGTGIRPNGLKQFGQAWFDECHGCNGCSGKGTSVKWDLDKYPGDTLTVAELDVTKLQIPFGFLHNRHWNEYERMGWFGAPAYTECERKDMEKPTADPDKWFGKCLHKNKKTGARVICWNEPEEIWSQEFVKRFIKPLNPDDTLILVDYHV